MGTMNLSVLLKLWRSLSMVVLHLNEPVGAGGHEPHVERDNKTFKERIRCIFASLPFARIPIRLTIELAMAVTYWLNCWCNSVGVSKTVSPRELIKGIRLDADKHLKFQFGEYVLGNEDDTNNGVTEGRRIDAIFLRPTGNRNGEMYLFDLATGRKVHKYRATPAHMTNTIIKRAEAIALAQGSPSGLLFGNAQGNTTIRDIEPEDYDSDYEDESDDEYHEDSDDEEEDINLTGADLAI